MNNIVPPSRKNQDLASQFENETKVKQIWSTPKLENLSCSHTLGAGGELAGDGTPYPSASK